MKKSTCDDISNDENKDGKGNLSNEPKVTSDSVVPMEQGLEIVDSKDIKESNENISKVCLLNM